jgi:hypothetical protein
MPRESQRHFSKPTKRLAWKRADGACECGCGLPLIPPHIRYDHRIPWWISRDSSLSYCQILRSECDRRKTYPHDLPLIAKAKRQEDFHLGISGPGLGARPMRYGARSALSKTFRNGVVMRVSQAEKHRATVALRYFTERRT